MKRFARHLGVSLGVASRLSLCCQDSSHHLYQHHWSCYRHWCAGKGHSVSHPSVAKLQIFFFFCVWKRGCRSLQFAGIIRPLRPCLSTSSRTFLPTSFCGIWFAHSLLPVRPLQWVDRRGILVKVLEYLWGPSFKPLASQSFSVKSLGEFLGDLPEERLLCPVRAVRVCLGMTSSLTPRPRSLFVSPRSLSHAVSKNAISYFLRWVILEAGVLWDGVPGAPRAHSIRGLATSAAFLHNWSVSKVLEAATWRSNPVFASFYSKDISYSLAN